MAGEVKDLKDLKKITETSQADSAAASAAESTKSVDTPVSETQVKREPQRDELGRSYATGRRKESVARVWVKPGSGKITINGRDIVEYLARPVLRMIVQQVFEITDRNRQFDVNCTVKGGGLSGQAGAIRHGLSRALEKYEPELRPVLKTAGLLTRDSRAVERKKYGRKKARKSFQFSKR